MSNLSALARTMLMRLENKRDAEQQLQAQSAMQFADLAAREADTQARRQESDTKQRLANAEIEGMQAQRLGEKVPEYEPRGLTQAAARGARSAEIAAKDLLGSRAHAENLKDIEYAGKERLADIRAGSSEYGWDTRVAMQDEYLRHRDQWEAARAAAARVKAGQASNKDIELMLRYGQYMLNRSKDAALFGTGEMVPQPPVEPIVGAIQKRTGVNMGEAQTAAPQAPADAKVVLEQLRAEGKRAGLTDDKIEAMVKARAKQLGVSYP